MLRGLLFAALATVVLLVFAVNGGRYEGPPSDHFDGAHFHNLAPTERSADALLSLLTTDWRSDWQEVAAPTVAPPPRRVAGARLEVTLIGHSTVLLQTGGLNILTDPVWSERAGPLSFVGTRRYRPPALPLADLPPIDVVLISHSHYDHLDLATLRALAERDAPLFLLGLGNDETLRRAGIEARVSTLDWWQTVALPGPIAVTAVPGQHWSSRGLLDRNRTLWLGFVIKAPGGPIYFAGDTAMGPHFMQIARRFGPPRLALLPIGAYRPAALMRGSHLSPAQAVAAHGLLDAARSIPIHWGTFRLSAEGMNAPVRALEIARQRAGLPAAAFAVAPFGQRQSIAPLPTTTR